MAPDNKQSPVSTSSADKNVGGKNETNKSEGGTLSAEDQKRMSDIREKQGKGLTLTQEESTFLQQHSDPQQAQRLATKLSPDAVSSPSQEEADKAKDSLVSETTEKDGQKVVVSALTQEDKDKAAKSAESIPSAVNETQRLTGVPGQVNLTQGGRLSGDKSVRDDRSLEEINEELNTKTGPNPTPNRDGNERLKAELGFNSDMMIGIERETTMMAEKLGKIREKGSLSEEDKRELEKMEDQLRSTGRS